MKPTTPNRKQSKYSKSQILNDIKLHGEKLLLLSDTPLVIITLKSEDYKNSSARQSLFSNQFLCDRD